MIERIIGNWKTSLLGLVAGLSTWFLAYQPDAGFTWAGLQTAIPSVLMGMLLKDQSKKQ
jgi:hypothetical protein